jgi:hypothetical protein
MKSIPEMIGIALKDGTKEKARQIVQWKVDEMMDVLGYEANEARRITLINIGYYTGYMDHETADKVMELFETEHPVFGRTHPTPQEAFRLGRELGEKMKKEKLIDNQES